MGVKQFVRGTMERLGLARLYFRAHEWRVTLGRERPPAAVDGVPMPPRYLMTLVAGTPDWRWFLQSGEKAAQAFDRYASEGGCGFAAAKRVLDLGCGCGRIARHLPKLTSAKIHGVDYNPQLIEWCARNLKGHFVQNRLHPPLVFPDAHFDVVYLMSVFTHLRHETQEEWLAELQRITRPGGVAVVTFHDEDHPGLPNTEEAHEALKGSGIYVYNNRIEGSNLMAVFQTREMTRKMFGRHFEVVRILSSPGTAVEQAVAILKRR